MLSTNSGDTEISATAHSDAASISSVTTWIANISPTSAMIFAEATAIDGSVNLQMQSSRSQDDAVDILRNHEHSNIHGGTNAVVDDIDTNAVIHAATISSNKSSGTDMISVPERYFVPDLNMHSLRDLVKVLEVMRYWMFDDVPDAVFDYVWDHRDMLLEVLRPAVSDTSTNASVKSSASVDVDDSNDAKCDSSTHSNAGIGSMSSHIASTNEQLYIDDARGIDEAFKSTIYEWCLVMVSNNVLEAAIVSCDLR